MLACRCGKQLPCNPGGPYNGAVPQGTVWVQPLMERMERTQALFPGTYEESKLNTSDLISLAHVWAAAQAGSQGSVLAHPGTSSCREWR